MRSLGIIFTVLCLSLLTACGEKEEESGSPAASATASATASAEATAEGAGTPLPEVDFADVEGGTTYTTKLFQPALTFTLPEGEWELYGADSPEHVELEPEADDPVDDAAIGFHHVTQVFDPKKGGKTPGDTVAAPEDFAKWLTDHPHLNTTTPKKTEALGLEGVSIDVRVKSSPPNIPDDCGKYEGDCVPLFIGKIEAILYASKTFGRFYVLEQPDGKQLVVEQFVKPVAGTKAGLKILDELLESATVAGG